MTFGVTEEGFKAKRMTDIVSELASVFKTELGIDIDASPDSVAKVLTNILALPLSEGWEATQALQSMFDVSKAEGKHLDDLVGYISLFRLSGVPSRGTEYITANKEISITSGSVFKDGNDNEYINSQTIQVDKSNLVEVTLSLSQTVGVGSVLTLVVNNIESIVTVATTVEAALTLLIDDVNNKTTSNLMTATYNSGDNTITITNVDDKVISTLLTSNNLIIDEIVSFGTINKDIDGAFSVEPNTVTIPPSVSGITSVTNRYQFVSGREEETDIDLRTRHGLSIATAGAATVEAIKADLLKVTGVTDVVVLENDSEVVDGNSLEPKSFLSIVKGGDSQDIGDALWITKGAGIETNGTETVIVIDSGGNPQAVNFSRPEAIYIHMNVEYSLYNEESDEFPIDGEQKMLTQILSYGEGLTLGEDVIPQRFASKVFATVGGLGTVNITVGSTVSPNDPTPILTPNILSINAISEAAFDGLRVSFTEV